MVLYLMVVWKTESLLVTPQIFLPQPTFQIKLSQVVYKYLVGETRSVVRSVSLCLYLLCVRNGPYRLCVVFTTVREQEVTSSVVIS